MEDAPSTVWFPRIHFESSKNLTATKAYTPKFFRGLARTSCFLSLVFCHLEAIGSSNLNPGCLKTDPRKVQASCLSVPLSSPSPWPHKGYNQGSKLWNPLACLSASQRGHVPSSCLGHLHSITSPLEANRRLSLCCDALWLACFKSCTWTARCEEQSGFKAFFLRKETT